MKAFYIFISLLLSVLMLSSKSYCKDEFPILKGPLMGQKPPGVEAEPFAPGIISTEDYDIMGVFAPSMKEFYFIRAGKDKKQNLIVYKFEDNLWKGSILGPREGEHVFSPDGKTMYLGSRFMERTSTGWSKVKSLGATYEDRPMPIMRLSSSSKGTYFFDERTRTGKGLIHYSRIINGKREQAKPLGKAINTGKWIAHPFIAPDESYIIFDGERDGGYGSSDLYISYRQQDGSWGEAINLGSNINSEHEDAYGSVTPDGKYLFFYRTLSSGNADRLPNVDIYWVDAKIIEELRHK